MTVSTTVSARASRIAEPVSAEETAWARAWSEEPPALRSALREHGHEDPEAERAAELLGDIDDARGGAGVVGRDARDARAGQRRQRHAHARAEQDDRHRDGREERGRRPTGG